MLTLSIESRKLTTERKFDGLLLILACIGAISTASAGRASAQTDEEFAIWSALFFTGQVYADSPSPTFWFDTQARRGERGTVYILRPGAGMAFAPWGSLWVGYAWVPVWTDATGERTDEQRIWEQLILNHQTNSGVFFQSRSRFEQRFSKGASGTANRFRQFVRLNYQPRQRVPVGIAFWDEVFVGIDSESWTKQGFDQNRLFLGLAIYALELFRVEVGYLNNYLAREPDQLTQALSINFFVTFKGSRHTH